MATPPERLIDPDGEGVYMLAGDPRWTLREIAWDFFCDAGRWRDLNYDSVWMREDDEGDWHPTRWRWWNGFGFREPTLYAYLTPKPEAM